MRSVRCNWIGGRHDCGCFGDLFKPEFDDFLHAPLASGEHEGHLTVLSALSRLDLDPWKEAEELSALPKDAAAGRLASFITQLPGGVWTNADARWVAHHLIGLLPESRIGSGAPTAKLVGVQRTRVSTAMLICIALGLAAAVIATNVSRSLQTSDADDALLQSRANSSAVPSVIHDL